MPPLLQPPTHINKIGPFRYKMSTVTVTKTTKAPDAEPVLGKLRYVPAVHVPQPSPHNFHLPALTDFGDERFLPLYSIRPLPTVSELPRSINHAQLNTHGFTAVHHSTPFHASPYNLRSFKDPQLLKQHLIPNTTEMMKQITGCKTVITESFLLRTSTWTEKDSLATHGEDVAEASELETGFPQFIGFNPKHGGASPASKIHLDFSPKGARTHIRKFHPGLAKAAADIINHEDSLIEDDKDLKESYKDCGGPRWALYSIWRPLKTVDRDPLAVIGQGSFSKEDCVPVDVYFPCLGTGTEQKHLSESLVVRYSDNHKWHWIDKQTPEEVLILRFFDSDAEGNGFVAGGGSFHSSVELPGTENEAARESLEIRVLCIW
ncbi:GA4 desaturase [Annulohypoxylon bovei var. microspora]|nr:GA4 desaturase [Annulohypoxylon bovei var. microspora]